MSVNKNRRLNMVKKLDEIPKPQSRWGVFLLVSPVNSRCSSSYHMATTLHTHRLSHSSFLCQQKP